MPAHLPQLGHVPFSGKMVWKPMDAYERAVAMWTIQDTLLQYYRSIFITSESILFAVAVGVASGNKPWITIVFLPIGFAILWAWMRVCGARGLNVYYFHWQLLRLEKGGDVPENTFTDFKQWQKRSPSQQREDFRKDEVGSELIARQDPPFTTRKILDFWLPLAFGVLWAVLTSIVATEVFLRH